MPDATVATVRYSCKLLQLRICMTAVCTRTVHNLTSCYYSRSKLLGVRLQYCILRSAFQLILTVVFTCMSCVYAYILCVYMQLQGHTKPVYGAAFHPGNGLQLLLSWSSDCTVRMWDCSTANGIATPLQVLLITHFWHILSNPC
jgi:WD40 repeat protein